VLIEGGAEVNARNNDGWTPLMIAARWCNNSEIILWLLDNGADATAENKLGKKAIFYARDNNVALEDTSALERLVQLAGE
jgi:ankyrin repeat protein